MRKFLKRNFINWAVVSLVRLYQNTASPDHGFLKAFYPYGYCRYYPTCSQYVLLSIKKYGLARGLLKSVMRICRCNPWARPRIDGV